MKRTFSLTLFILIFSVLLFGCGQTQTETDTKTLSFPGTDWSMTPEELIDALNLRSDNYTLVPPEEVGAYYQIKNVHMDVFGAESEVLFVFKDINNDGAFHLSEVYAAYPDETDFDAVLAAMTSQYGEPTIGAVYQWLSEATIKDFMSEEDLALLYERAEAAGAGEQDWIEGPISSLSLIIDSERYKVQYNDTTVTNLLYFYSTASAYTDEGGYYAMFSDN